MKYCLCLVLSLALVGIAGADTFSDNAKAAQKTADAFFKALADNNFNAFKDAVSSTRLAEYTANNANCPIARWWETAREEIDKHKATWVFAEISTNMPTAVGLNYKRTMDSGETMNYIQLVKEGDKWLVDAAGAI